MRLTRQYVKVIAAVAWEWPPGAVVWEGTRPAKPDGSNYRGIYAAFDSKLSASQVKVAEEIMARYWPEYEKLNPDRHNKKPLIKKVNDSGRGGFWIVVLEDGPKDEVHRGSDASRTTFVPEGTDANQVLKALRSVPLPQYTGSQENFRFKLPATQPGPGKPAQPAPIKSPPPDRETTVIPSLANSIKTMKDKGMSKEQVQTLLSKYGVRLSEAEWKQYGFSVD